MHSIKLTEEKIASRLAVLERRMLIERHPLMPFKVHYGEERLTDPKVDDTAWPQLLPGQYWGEYRQTFTMRTQFVVPKGWDGAIELLLPLGNSASLKALSFLYGPEALVFVDGEPLIGLAPNRTFIPLPDKYRDGKVHSLALYGWTGIKDEKYCIGEASLVRVNVAVKELHARMRVHDEAMRLLAADQPARVQLLQMLDDAVQAVDWRADGDRFDESVHRALRIVQEGASACGAPLETNVAAVGHGHLDLAWLWTLEQTKEKGARTFSNVLRLMERDESFVFAQSQPQLYQYVEMRYPAIFEQIADRVRQGRWELLGGMWVESDCNLPSAEALVRQFVLGREYFMSRFGTPGSPVVWLPDVFGFNWQLPQVMKLAHMHYFVTAKLTWNKYNTFPYDSFWWKGLDGTEILSHLITTSKPGWWGATYSADLTPEEVMNTWRNRQDPHADSETLIAYGFGDGGGGPTREMVERAELLAAHPGFPRVRHSSAMDFFERLDRQAGERLPVWDGELYFELHRGTYTTQARNKLHNRKCEFMLHDAEFLSAWAALQGLYAYPRERLNEAWRILCLNQFHDIIPGSSIKEVYEQSERDYASIRAIAGAIIEEALTALEATMPADAEWVVYNPTSFTRSETIALAPDLLEEGTAPYFNGHTLPVQQDGNHTLVRLPEIPPYGFVAITKQAIDVHTVSKSTNLYVGPVEQAPVSTGSQAEAYLVLENDSIRAEFDRAGDLVRLLDKRVNREVLAPGAKANEWQAFEDMPLDWDAWDIDLYYQDVCELAQPASQMKVIEAGALRAGIEVTRTIRNSAIVQRIYLHEEGASLEFQTTIDWREDQTLLKVAFPVDIRSDHATYDIQWGNIERPTHTNTRWDWAKFEACAHKWVDLSERNYGVSLLNDCKYGYDIRGNVIRLTALRSPTFPDPTADRGVHTFVYKLLPHEGDWTNGVPAEAYALNNPLIVHRMSGQTRHGDCAAAYSRSLVRSDSRQVIIETVKLAEADDSLICRVYENERTRGQACLTTSIAFARASVCDVYEEEDKAISYSAGSAQLPYRPYQIATVKFSK